MEDYIHTYLKKFDAVVNPIEYFRKKDICREAFNFEPVQEIPFVYDLDKNIISDDWPDYSYNATFEDREKMLLDQFRLPYLHYRSGDYHPVNIRCNYGTVIVPSIFGIPFQLTETSMPWCGHLRSREDVKKLIRKGKPDIFTGLGSKIIETGMYFREQIGRYHNLDKVVSLYHPDFQGPLDIAHLIWGPDIFYALYDCPDQVHDLLKLVTDTYLEIIENWFSRFPKEEELSTHWSMFMKGEILLRNDSAVLISPEHYEEFSFPYEQRILNEYPGGIHFCGNGSAFFKTMLNLKNLQTIHVGQPELNVMSEYISFAQEKQVVLVDVPEKFAGTSVSTGVFLKKQLKIMGNP